MKTTPKDHLESILTRKSSPLANIFALYRHNEILTREFHKTLPEKYRPHLRFILYKAGVMSLGVTNSAMLTRMKYESFELLALFKKEVQWAGLREIKIKILI